MRRPAVGNRYGTKSNFRDVGVHSDDRSGCDRRMSAFRAERASAKDIRSTGDEKTGAAGLAPDTLVARSRRTVVVVAGEELALVDPQFTVEEMQLFDARVGMRGVTGAGRKAHEHANPVPLCVRREQLAFDPRRDLLPFGLGPLSRRWQYRRLPGLLGDATRKASLQGGRRAQHVCGPGDELSDHRAEALQLALAIRTRGDVRFGRRNFARR